jgi:hypothetical protein
VNTDWALEQLTEVLRLLEYKSRSGMYAATYVGTEDEVSVQKVVVDRIWSKVLGLKPVVPISGDDPYRFDREWTIRCIETIRRDAEIRENLGEDAPDLNAASMHRWVWNGGSDPVAERSLRRGSPKLPLNRLGSIEPGTGAGPPEHDRWSVSARRVTVVDLI